MDEKQQSELVAKFVDQWPILRLTLGDWKATLVLPYLLGAERQMQRYHEAYSHLDTMDIRTSLNVMHEVACLLEDLATIAVFMRERQHDHPMHELWEQARHHFRHDLRDSQPSPRQLQQTETRASYLGFKEGLFSEIGWQEDGVKLGERTVTFREVEEYLEWAKGTLAAAGPDIDIDEWLKANASGIAA